MSSSGRASAARTALAVALLSVFLAASWVVSSVAHAVRSLRSRRGAVALPSGVPLPATSQPALRSHLAASGELVLDLTTTLHVDGDSLRLGLPLLAAVSSHDLHAAVAHHRALGSRASGWTGPYLRRGAVLLRSRSAVPLVPAFTRLFSWAADDAIRRQQALAQQVPGAVAALERIRTIQPELGQAWSWYTDRFLAPAVRTGKLPVDLLEGFARLLAGPDHPALQVADPALGLVDLPAVATGLGLLVSPLPLEPISLDAAAAVAASARARASAADLMAACEHARAAVEPVGLGTVLEDATRGAQVVGDRLLGGPSSPEQASAALVSGLTDLLRCGLVDTGQAAWQASLTGAPYQLMSPGFGPVDLTEAVRSALSEGGLEELRQRCAALGLPDDYRGSGVVRQYR